MKRLLVFLILAFGALPLLAQDDAPTATLGITYRPNGTVSVVINTVEPGSAADRAGVQPDDALIAIDGNFVNFESVPDVLREYDPGDVVTLLIIRDDVTFEVETALDGRLPASDPGLLIGGDEEDPIVIGIAEGSAAEGAGLEIGDRLVFIDGQQVDTGAAARATLNTLAPGDTVTIIIDREGSAIVRTLDVTEGEFTFSPAEPTPERDDDDTTPGQLGVFLDDTSGFPVVTDIVPGSPADEAGVRIGEIIRSVNGIEVRTTRAVIDARNRFGAGEQIYLVLWADGNARLIFLTLAESE